MAVKDRITQTILPAGRLPRWVGSGYGPDPFGSHVLVSALFGIVAYTAEP
jgi:hypothetical protein